MLLKTYLVLNLEEALTNLTLLSNILLAISLKDLSFLYLQPFLLIYYKNLNI